MNSRQDTQQDPQQMDQQQQQQEGGNYTGVKRKCADFHACAVIDVKQRLLFGSSIRSSYRRRRDAPHLQPHSRYLRLMGLPIGCSGGGREITTAFCTHMAHVTRAKNSHSVMCLSWTPGGRRLLTGNQEGEFTLWDGINFSFELIMSAHDTSFRCMEWSHNSNYLLTADAGGNIKFWSPSIAPVNSVDSHNQQPIHALSFSPSDTKFVSCGDDSSVRVWDYADTSEERVLEGHGWVSYL